MMKISDHIYIILREQQFADPFSDEFDSKKLKSEFGNSLNQEAENLLDFLIICNKLYEDLKRNIFALFDKLNFAPQDLREFSFLSINKYYLDLTPKMFEQARGGFVHEAEKTTFTKFTNEAGQEVSSQFAIEIGGDILSVLIKLSYEWNPNESEFRKLTNYKPELHDKLFQFLWIHANILLNLRDSAYDIIKYENGKVIFRDDYTIKIENGLNATLYLKNAGTIRDSNHMQEFLFPFLQFYEKAFEKRIGVEGFEINDTVLSPIKGKSDISVKAKADASLYVSYPHFTEDKLEYFDGLTLYDLLDLIVLIEECVEKLLTKNITEYSERKLLEIPIKFKETNLIKFLSKVSGIQISTVQKFISSITANTQQPYFWREPLFKSDGFLYFSLAAIAAPNHVLFLDKWTTLNGFSIEDKEIKYTQFVLKELTESKKIEYQFDFIDLSVLNINVEKFQNNILIETASLLILLEIKLFDFPIESPEIDAALTRLGTAAFDVKEKATQILENFDSQKELINIIIPNYTNFSGLVINNIPVADLTLFTNYVVTGNFKRAAVIFHEGKPIINDGGIISYYRDETEFNNNLKSFFYDPLPVRHILERLILKEQQITPDFVNPKFMVDMIDHITDAQLMDSRMENLSGLLNYEYFEEPDDKVIKFALDQSIIYSLTEIFSQLSYSKYEFYQDRIKLYHNISKTKMLGFAHLAFYILKALEKLNGKKIKEKKVFESVNYDSDEVFKIIKQKNVFLSGKIQLSEFKIIDGTFSTTDEKKIISFSIDVLSGLTPKHFGSDILETSIFPLALLHGLCHKYDVEFEFYSACSNVVDALNHIHKYQSARDFCEEILLLSIKNNKHSQGWNILFKCYTTQKSTFDASINGCLFLSSLSVLPEISNFLAVDALYGALKYFRNFGFTEFAKYTYENLQNFELTEYDSQKITLSYFNSFFQGEMQRDISILDQVLDYVENKIDAIIDFEEHGVIPWLAYFYNIERLKSTKQIIYNRDVSKYITKLENSIDKKSVEAIRLKVLGDTKKPKELFISAILSTFETRSVRDFVHEAQHLSLIASNLLQSSIVKEDIDGILLSGLIINDQSLTFKEVSVEEGSITAISKSENAELKLRLNNYKFYLLTQINLKPNQLLIWLFEDIGKVYFLAINSKKEFKFAFLDNWDLKRTKFLLKRIGNFYFNVKKDINKKPKCIYSNPRGEQDYNNLIQAEDYENLRKELVFTNLNFDEEHEEILFCASIEMASFPHNLIEFKYDFIASQKPICNIISIERFIEKNDQILLQKDYSISAWIPTEDQEPTINWGFEILDDTLKRINSKIFTSTYPKESITSDLNIFLAHGVMDGTGFKAVYTNHVDKKVIAFPYSVFGEGKIAILFICNSGSSHEALFSNSLVSFSGELLKSGYESVVAPFWPFDVTMSRIWLEEFLAVFNQGFSINEAVYLANHRLTKYDEATSSIYNAPAGCLAMHLYGNPNIYVRQ